MQLKDAVTNMFGFIWSQPIHQTLRQMRLIQVGLIVSSQWLLWDIVAMIQGLDPTQAAVALGAVAAALIAQIWASVSSIHKSNHSDN